MEKYKIGTVFQLYEGEEQEYVILNNVKLESGLYLLITPIEMKNGEVKTDYSKVMLLNVNEKTDEISIETDREIVKQVVASTINILDDK